VTDLLEKSDCLCVEQLFCVWRRVIYGLEAVFASSSSARSLPSTLCSRISRRNLSADVTARCRHAANARSCAYIISPLRIKFMETLTSALCDCSDSRRRMRLRAGRLPLGRRLRRLLALQGWPDGAQQEVSRGHPLQWSHVRPCRPCPLPAGKIGHRPSPLPRAQRRRSQVSQVVFQTLEIIGKRK